MKKKTRVLIISYTAALVAALAVGLIACRTDANRSQTAMDANYRHAYGEVLNAVQELDSSLQKSLYATTAAMECTVCTDIYSNAQTAEMALGFGADDMDGTIDDSTKIYSMAGAEEKPRLTVDDMRAMAASAGLRAVERDTFYNEIVR